MKLFNTLIFICLMLCISFFSCQSRVEPADKEPDMDYFPLSLGDFWEYQMDSVIYDNLGTTIDSTRSYTREELVDMTVFENGDTSFVLEISFRRDTVGSWEPKNQWTITKAPNHIIRTEENLPFKKILFPTNEGDEWEGTLFDKNQIEESYAGEPIRTYKNWKSIILQKGITESILGVKYDDILIIQQADDENAIEKRLNIEKYQRNIGLVNKRMMILDTQNTSSNNPWVEKAEKGFTLNQTLVNHNI